jgi:hypothetical protein
MKVSFINSFFKKQNSTAKEKKIWGWGCTSVIEQLSSMCEALGSIPSTAKSVYLSIYQPSSYYLSIHPLTYHLSIICSYFPAWWVT